MADQSEGSDDGFAVLSVSTHGMEVPKSPGGLRKTKKASLKMVAYPHQNKKSIFSPRSPSHLQQRPSLHRRSGSGGARSSRDFGSAVDGVATTPDDDDDSFGLPFLDESDKGTEVENSTSLSAMFDRNNSRALPSPKKLSRSKSIESFQSIQSWGIVPTTSRSSKNEQNRMHQSMSVINTSFDNSFSPHRNKVKSTGELDTLVGSTETTTASTDDFHSSFQNFGSDPFQKVNNNSMPSPSASETNSTSLPYVISDDEASQGGDDKETGGQGGRSKKSIQSQFQQSFSTALQLDPFDENARGFDDDVEAFPRQKAETSAVLEDMLVTKRKSEENMRKKLEEKDRLIANLSKQLEKMNRSSSRNFTEESDEALSRSSKKSRGSKSSKKSRGSKSSKSSKKKRDSRTKQIKTKQENSSSPAGDSSGHLRLNMCGQIYDGEEILKGGDESWSASFDNLSSDSADQAARQDARRKVKKAEPKRRNSTGALKDKTSEARREARKSFDNLSSDSADQAARQDARRKAKKTEPKRRNSTGALKDKTKSKKSKTERRNSDGARKKKKKKRAEGKDSSDDKMKGILSKEAIEAIADDDKASQEARREARRKAKKSEPQRRHSDGNLKEKKKSIRTSKLKSLIKGVSSSSLGGSTHDNNSTGGSSLAAKEARREARRNAKKSDPYRRHSEGNLGVKKKEKRISNFFKSKRTSSQEDNSSLEGSSHTESLLGGSSHTGSINGGSILGSKSIDSSGNETPADKSRTRRDRRRKNKLNLNTVGSGEGVSYELKSLSSKDSMGISSLGTASSNAASSTASSKKRASRKNSLNSSGHSKKSSSKRSSRSSVMRPKPGQLLVEFHKDGDDGKSTKEKLDSGLDVTFKAGYDNHVFLSKVEPPASEKLTVGDRLISLNGKSIDSFGDDLDKIRRELRRNNVVALLVDPTLQK